MADGFLGNLLVYPNLLFAVVPQARREQSVRLKDFPADPPLNYHSSLIVSALWWMKRKSLPFGIVLFASTVLSEREMQP